MDQVRGRLRLHHYCLRTEQAYVSWIRRFILANGQRHPGQMGHVEGEAFLTELATRGQVSAGTQEVARLLTMLEGTCRLVAGLLYGRGCGCWNACACGPRRWTWFAAKLWCATAGAQSICGT
ncbi:hypothetical protein XFF6166_130061 [Xanthomonas citri pv. fuscans]|nr:hypothetical protein XFF6166_130061 [Xanthomonas citri pv. fuscans]SON98672.1 hypothetical protein XFF6960_100060 [Xanthomonas citri pv. fuscans]SOO05642.1 hypothetical protein XFF7767_470001 [Xanthomonas citri pv. fuscans]SOO08594.1 hypothetical protein XFF6970_240062 [Xanthomonas citri pv. fuscans]SOO14640.1 hypothetical protein XFF7766_340001 [Xanthomonas citri pv. fuscans]